MPQAVAVDLGVELLRDGSRCAYRARRAVPCANPSTERRSQPINCASPTNHRLFSLSCLFTIPPTSVRLLFFPSAAAILLQGEPFFHPFKFNLSYLCATLRSRYQARSSISVPRNHYPCFASIQLRVHYHHHPELRLLESIQKAIG